jgi:hypothetical protein
VESSNRPNAPLLVALDYASIFDVSAYGIPGLMGLNIHVSNKSLNGCNSDNCTIILMYISYELI